MKIKTCPLQLVFAAFDGLCWLTVMLVETNYFFPYFLDIRLNKQGKKSLAPSPYNPIFIVTV